IGTNLYNDVGDYERGADRSDRLGPPRATSMGWLAATDVRRAAATSFGLAMVLGAYLVSVGGWPIFVIGLASIAAGISYTGGPRPIAYTPSGEFFVFVFFGLVATIGSSFLQTGRFSWESAAGGRWSARSRRRCSSSTTTATWRVISGWAKSRSRCAS